MTSPALIVGVVSNVINVMFNLFFIWGFPPFWHGFGFIGSSVSTSATRVFQTLLLFGYMLYTGEGRATWGGWSKDALSAHGLVEVMECVWRASSRGKFLEICPLIMYGATPDGVVVVLMVFFCACLIEAIVSRSGDPWFDHDGRRSLGF